MTEEKLLAFIQHILDNCRSIEDGSRSSAGDGQLRELRNILRKQDIPNNLMRILDDAIGSEYDEIDNLAKNHALTKDQIDTARKRQIQREREEMERNQYRGCH